MSQQSQGKRKSASQASLISNYFKRIESSSTQKSRPTPSENAPSKTAPEPQHPVADIADEDPESNDVERTTRTTKRRRLITPPISSEPSRPITPTVAGERNALTALMNPNVKEFRPPPESPRTARYKYTGLSTANAEEPSTPEQIAKKKSLHEKFVAKLGRPESMALFRRKSQGERQPGDEEEDEVSGEGEEEEEEAEEVSVAAKSLRGKYGSAAAAGKKTAAASKKSTVASITKFTPLERQYMEIKKQYPDTLLLIEVGYKFRFFGEDAKVFATGPHWKLIGDRIQGIGNSAFHEPQLFHCQHPRATITYSCQTVLFIEGKESDLGLLRPGIKSVLFDRLRRLR